MSGAIDQIRRFVEGAQTVAEFEQALYNDASLEQVLADDPDRPAQSYVGRSLYHYLIGLDYTDPGGVLNAQGALEEFLKRKGVAVSPTDTYSDFYDLVLDSQPGWLDVRPKYVKERLMPEAGNRSGVELRQWLRERLLKEFRFASQPPEWIQSPEWPVVNGKPLVFLGQLEVEHYFHDEAAVFVFHDPDTGECQTVIQVA
jgi:hypothetical protein